MKQVFNVVVSESMTTTVEKTLNALRVGLNYWSKNVFNVDGCTIVNYTVICDINTYNSLMNVLWMN